MDLQGSHVLITGGSRGIGAAMGRAFAEAGARVTVLARSEASAQPVAAEIRGVPFAADLADDVQVRGLIDRVERQVGPLDVVVHNAGDLVVAPFAALDEERAAHHVAVNLTAPIRLTRQVLPGMIDRGRGHLVFVSSLQGVIPTPGCAAYGATKSGLTHFAGILGLELRGTPIGLTVVEPGPVATDMWLEIEASRFLRGTLDRFRDLRLLTSDDPSDVAVRVVRAVAEGRTHVRSPKRAAALFWLEAAPRAITRALLRGVPLEARVASHHRQQGASMVASPDDPG